MSNLPALSNQNSLEIAGQQANQYAAFDVFEGYRDRRAVNTLRRQDGDLKLFEAYLNAALAPSGGVVCNLNSDPQCWRGITHGLMQGFINWQLAQSYAIGSVNVRLATVKVYAELAFKAGVIAADEHSLIKTVRGYGFKEHQNINEKRTASRRGYKKARATEIQKPARVALKTHPETPQGRRDRVIMCLLVDHGLRCSEVAGLKVSDINLETGVMRVYRKKTKSTDFLKMSADTLRAMTAYINQDVPALADHLLQGSVKGGTLAGRMTERAINKRVGTLGRAAGINLLSPHDLRHDAATRAGKLSDVRTLMDSFGWNSSAMAARYMNSTKIANERLVISDED
ncbi:MAG: tyrosine-type recombinase/integrase [Chloroflexota bacterium]